MILLCPKCESKVATPSGLEIDAVECGNCGTILTAKEDQIESKSSPRGPVRGGPEKPSWWSRIFGNADKK